jgi:hypothetical protein
MPATSTPSLTDDPQQEKLARELTAELELRHGSLLGGAELQRALGFRSGAAFRQAHHRGVLPVAVFAIPSRRGRYALTRDVARWLASLRHAAIQKGSLQEEAMTADTS